MCIDVLATWISVYHVYVPAPWSPEDDIRFPGITDGWELIYGHWELNLGFLEEQLMHFQLSSLPSLYRSLMTMEGSVKSVDTQIIRKGKPDLNFYKILIQYKGHRIVKEWMVIPENWYLFGKEVI